MVIMMRQHLQLGLTPCDEKKTRTSYLIFPDQEDRFQIFGKGFDTVVPLQDLLDFSRGIKMEEDIERRFKHIAVVVQHDEDTNLKEKEFKALQLWAVTRTRTRTTCNKPSVLQRFFSILVIEFTSAPLHLLFTIVICTPWLFPSAFIVSTGGGPRNALRF
jgi:hypothetical protein